MGGVFTLGGRVQKRKWIEVTHILCIVWEDARFDSLLLVCVDRCLVKT